MEELNEALWISSHNHKVWARAHENGPLGCRYLHHTSRLLEFENVRVYQSLGNPTSTVSSACATGSLSKSLVNAGADALGVCAEPSCKDKDEVEDVSGIPRSVVERGRQVPLSSSRSSKASTRTSLFSNPASWILLLVISVPLICPGTTAESSYSWVTQGVSRCRHPVQTSLVREGKWHLIFLRLPGVKSDMSTQRKGTIR